MKYLNNIKANNRKKKFEGNLYLQLFSFIFRTFRQKDRQENILPFMFSEQKDG